MRPISSHVLYLDLLQDLGLSYDADLTICPWDSSSLAARKALAVSFLKKFSDGADVVQCDKVAFDKFLSANERCGAWQLKCETLQDELLVNLFKEECYRFFQQRNGDPLIHSFSSLLDEARCGPGSSLGSESTDFYTKLFDSNLSCTSSGLSRAYANYIRLYPLWLEAEETRFRALGSSHVVDGNRLSFVPKDTTTSRSICIEPVLNMFYQLGMGRKLEFQLKRSFGIDLATQPDVNRRLACRGSEKNDLVTIDLSSASDTISLAMLEKVLPREFFAWLTILRSPSTSYNGRKVDLNMVSTMGNGFTFPLQTAIFSCVVMAAYKLHDISGHSRVPLLSEVDELPHPWSVFGDDIICSSLAARSVLRLLGLLGFEVNHNKTFLEGPFRESCGYDFFKGHNIRGVYCKSLLETQDRYKLINLLNSWSSRNGIYLPRSISYLLRTVPRIAVPPWENVDCGIWLPERLLFLYRSKLRVNKNGSRLYRRFIPKATAMTVHEDYIHVPRHSKPRRYNPAGLYMAFLSGSITNGKILTRSGKVRYVTKWGVAPSWSNHPTVKSPFKDSFGGRGLESPEISNILIAW